MLKRLYWRNIKIGGKYTVIFSVLSVTFFISILITFSLLNNLSKTMEDSQSINQTAIDVGNLVALYDEKYILIPEYILLSEDEKLNEYLEYSKKFVSIAKILKKNLPGEHLAIFNKMIENNHQLDEYFFSIIVPNVQDINTEQFMEMQQSANELKNETVQLGEELREVASNSSRQALNNSHDSIRKTIFFLIISGSVSIVTSFLFLYIMSKKISKDLNEIVITSEKIANGQLNIEVLSNDGADEIGQLSKSINHMGNSLREMISEVSVLASEVDKQSLSFLESSEEVKLGSEQVAITIEELAKGATTQATDAATISQNTKEFSDSLVEASQHSEELVRFSNDVLDVSINGDKQMKGSLAQMQIINRVVQTSVDKVRSLENKTQAITEIVHVIKSIADQTNLLSLNASIEAARAGEAGKGFAVVAEEVRKLSEEVSNSVENITNIVYSIKTETSKIAEELNDGFIEVNKGTEQIELTGKQFTNIKEKVAEMSGRVKMISSIFTQFQRSSKEITESVENIAAISEEAAAGSEEISASVLQQSQTIDNIASNAKKMTNMVERMNEMIRKFKL